MLRGEKIAFRLSREMEKKPGPSPGPSPRLLRPPGRPGHLRHHEGLGATWNSHVHREFAGNLESTNLSRDNLSRESGPRGRRAGCRAPGSPRVPGATRKGEVDRRSMATGSPIASIADATCALHVQKLTPDVRDAGGTHAVMPNLKMRRKSSTSTPRHMLVLAAVYLCLSRQELKPRAEPYTEWCSTPSCPSSLRSADSVKLADWLQRNNEDALNTRCLHLSLLISCSSDF